MWERQRRARSFGTQSWAIGMGSPLAEIFREGPVWWVLWMTTHCESMSSRFSISSMSDSLFKSKFDSYVSLTVHIDIPLLNWSCTPHRTWSSHFHHAWEMVESRLWWWSTLLVQGRSEELSCAQHCGISHRPALMPDGSIGPRRS